jgi:glycosyltransferase involved in cell wall biosynthesis
VMSDRLSIPSDRVAAVWNGIDLKGYEPAPQPPAVPTVGFLSHMTPPKGLSILIDAFKLLRVKMPNARLRIAGSVPGSSQAYVDGLKKDAARDGLSDVIDFLPNVDRDEKIRFLQSISVLSVPATYGEAFGLYILEAHACGVPVVQPNHAAFPEILEATGGGILCEPRNPRDLADKLYELLNDAPRRAAMGTGAREQVLAHFSIERAAREVVGVFEKAKERLRG